MSYFCSYEEYIMIKRLEILQLIHIFCENLKKIYLLIFPIKSLYIMGVDQFN